MSSNTQNMYIGNISSSGLTIYDPIDITDNKLWIPTPILQEILSQKLVNLSLTGLPLRTRSRVLKENVCKSLGYPVPRSFSKTQPRFPGQNFDTYIQKSNNLQIWNEEIKPDRRYVIIKLDNSDMVKKVVVLSGQDLSLMDRTGTLTRKYQARLNISDNTPELISPSDTASICTLPIQNNYKIQLDANPTDLPTAASLLPIEVVFDNLKTLIGKSFEDSGYDQERNRGAGLHQLVCQKLGYKNYADNGKFPDILNQLLELKLQTSPTIDLGLVSPDSTDYLDIPDIKEVKIRHCDVRYAIFYGNTDGKTVSITNFFLTTGEKFFMRFPKFQGKVINAKIQIPLPSSLFN